MSFRRFLRERVANTLVLRAYAVGDVPYVAVDKVFIRRTQNLRLTPSAGNRRGGKTSYGEWCHVVGIFQTLLHLHAHKSEGLRILDAGCGAGLLAIASEPLLRNGGSYVGIDVNERDVDYCREHYPSPPFTFEHLDVFNATYAPGQARAKQPWPTKSASMDMVTALSVWTHLGEQDARFYFAEIDRVLAPGGKAMVTFFLLDDDYQRSVAARTARVSEFHGTRQDRWLFTERCAGSEHWFHPKWVAAPEEAIGVTPAGLALMLAGTSLRLSKTYPGNWKELAGVYFQDVLIFEKAP